jgi:circadian clock protein KaiC
MVKKIKKEKNKVVKKKLKSKTSKATVFDMASIKSEIEQQLKSGKIKENEAQILEQRAPIKHLSKLELKEKKTKKGGKEYVKTGIPGFDELFESGIPKGNSILVAGGAGSGKTIFCLQTFAYHASQGEKCFYMSFEESEEKLIGHMKDFNWDPEKLIKSGKLKIKRYSPFEITTSVEAMLAKEKGELLIDLEPVILPEKFKPDFVVLDSLTAVASAFTGREDSYRIYIEQLFRFFEKIGSTSFLITETEQIPKIFSTTGVEEFLADGVIVFYNIEGENTRENAIEVLKMRGEKHQKKIVAMQITNKGIVVYPKQEVFGEVGTESV